MDLKYNTGYPTASEKYKTLLKFNSIISIRRPVSYFGRSKIVLTIGEKNNDNDNIIIIYYVIIIIMISNSTFLTTPARITLTKLN